MWCKIFQTHRLKTKFGQFWIKALKAEQRKSHNINNINITSALCSFESTPLRGLAARAKPGGSQTNAAVNSLSAAKLWVCGDPHPWGFTPALLRTNKQTAPFQSCMCRWTAIPALRQRGHLRKVFHSEFCFDIKSVMFILTYFGACILDNGLVSFIQASCWEQGWCKKKNLNEDKMVPSEALKQAEHTQRFFYAHYRRLHPFILPFSV